MAMIDVVINGRKRLGASMDERPSIDLKGIVIAAEWAPDGDVTAVDIAGYDEKRYRIADDSRGRQLRRLVKRKVVSVERYRLPEFSYSL